MLYRVHFAIMGLELTTLVVIGTDCTGSCKSNFSLTLISIPKGVDNLRRFWFLSFRPFGLGVRRGSDRMVVGFTTTCTISAYHH
jgi:hypothetical protein